MHILVVISPRFLSDNKAALVALLVMLTGICINHSFILEKDVDLHCIYKSRGRGTMLCGEGLKSSRTKG